MIIFLSTTTSHHLFFPSFFFIISPLKFVTAGEIERKQGILWTNLPPIRHTLNTRMFQFQNGQNFPLKKQERMAIEVCVTPPPTEPWSAEKVYNFIITERRFCWAFRGGQTDGPSHFFFQGGIIVDLSFQESSQRSTPCVLSFFCARFTVIGYVLKLFVSIALKEFHFFFLYFLSNPSTFRITAGWPLGGGIVHCSWLGTRTVATFSVRKFFSSHFSLEINSGGEPNGGADRCKLPPPPVTHLRVIKTSRSVMMMTFFSLSFSPCIYMCKFLFSPLLVAGLI